MQDGEVVRIRKLLHSFMKTTKAFKGIVQKKYGGDEDKMNDISKLSLSEIRICVNHKHQPEDEAIPTSKKELLTHWMNTKHRDALTEVEFLITSTTASEDVIAILGEELYEHTSDIIGNCSISNKVIRNRINEVTSTIKLDAIVI